MSQGLIAVIIGAFGCVWYLGYALIRGALPINPGWRDQRVPAGKSNAPITFWAHVAVVAALAILLSTLALNWPQNGSGGS